MIIRSKNSGKNLHTTEADAESITEIPTLHPEVEKRLRDEFEDLIRRMQSPQSAAAYDRLSSMSGEEIHDFLRTLREPQTKPHPPSGAAELPPVAFIPLSRAEELDYPCIVLASLNYFAAGEGHLLGVLVVRASSAEHLRSELSLTWDDYYTPSIQIRRWDDLSDDGALLPTEPAKRILTRGLFRPSALRFVSTLHVRYA